MDSSPSSTDSPLAPKETRLATVAQQADAIDELITSAQSKLCVFDRDLVATGWNTSLRARNLEAFVRKRGARLSIIVHDTRYLESACPRVVDLLKVYGHAIEVRRTGTEARAAADALVIADEAHYLHRYHVDQPRATLAIAMPAQAKPLVARFEEIWSSGERALAGTVTGL
ncbi:MAG TPA: hypothetical protein VNG69_18295 [Casimicrobiaceae bacterium]|nr:hypothetical protein [Casimicrobiaceae bacterium]